MPSNITPVPSSASTAGASAPPPTSTASAPPPLPTGTSSVAGGAVSPQNAGRGSFLRNLSPAQQSVVQQTYDETRQFHGTNSAGKSSIRQDGFDVNRKAGGATETVASKVGPGSRFVADAGRHNYLTGNRNTAKNYAKTGAGDNALVRTIVNQHAVGLHSDPDSMPSDLAVRTKHAIPAGNVLQSKQHGDNTHSNLANREFRDQLHNRGLNVSESHARELLNDVQSDSEDDEFDSARAMGV